MSTAKITGKTQSKEWFTGEFARSEPSRQSYIIFRKTCETHRSTRLPPQRRRPTGPTRRGVVYPYRNAHRFRDVYRHLSPIAMRRHMGLHDISCAYYIHGTFQGHVVQGL